MIQNKTQVETVNFRLYFKVIFRQNEIQYFTTHIYVYNAERERASVMWAEGRIIEAKHDKEISKKLKMDYLAIFTTMFYISKGLIKVERKDSTSRRKLS